MGASAACGQVFAGGFVLSASLSADDAGVERNRNHPPESNSSSEQKPSPNKSKLSSPRSALQQPKAGQAGIHFVFRPANARAFRPPAAAEIISFGKRHCMRKAHANSEAGPKGEPHRGESKKRTKEKRFPCKIKSLLLRHSCGFSDTASCRGGKRRTSMPAALRVWRSQRLSTEGQPRVSLHLPRSAGPSFPWSAAIAKARGVAGPWPQRGSLASPAAGCADGGGGVGINDGHCRP